MDKKRNYRRVLLVVGVVWLAALGLLYFLVPVQPRLTIRAAAPSWLIGFTSDSRTMFTADLQVGEKVGKFRPLFTGTVRKWDLVTGDELTQVVLTKLKPARPAPKVDPEEIEDEPELQRIGRVWLAPGGQALTYRCSNSSEYALFLWNLAANRKMARIVGGWNSEFSPDGAWVAVKGMNSEPQTVRLFESATGKEIFLELPEQRVHERSLPVFSPDSRLLGLTARIGKRYETQVWQLSPLRLLWKLDGYQYHHVFSDNGKLLAYQETKGSVRLMDVDTGLTRHVLQLQDEWTFELAFAPDGRTVTAFSDSVRDGSTAFTSATTWDTETGQCLKRFVPIEPLRDPNETWANDNDVPGKPRLYSQTNDSGTIIFDAMKGVKVAAVQSNGWLVRLSPNNEILVSHEQLDLFDAFRPKGIMGWLRVNIPGFARTWPVRRHLQLWDLSSSRKIASFNSEASFYRFTPDSKTLVLTNDTERIEVWDVPPGLPIKTILLWSLPLPMLIFAVGEWRFRRRRKRDGQAVSVA